MNLEKLPRVEQTGKNRERLLLLEKEGKYVFHGSPETIETLEPRQAENKNQETGEMEPHGEPAICATKFAEVAIFRALTNFSDEIGPANVSFGTNESGELQFFASSNVLELAKRKTGRVYVLDKHEFEPLFDGGSEWRSLSVVKPKRVVEVSFEDLPQNIQIISGEK